MDAVAYEVVDSSEQSSSSSSSPEAASVLAAATQEDTGIAPVAAAVYVVVGTVTSDMSTALDVGVAVTVTVTVKVEHVSSSSAPVTAAAVVKGEVASVGDAMMAAADDEDVYASVTADVLTLFDGAPSAPVAVVSVSAQHSSSYLYRRSTRRHPMTLRVAYPLPSLHSWSPDHPSNRPNYDRSVTVAVAVVNGLVALVDTEFVVVVGAYEFAASISHDCLFDSVRSQSKKVACSSLKGMI